MCKWGTDTPLLVFVPAHVSHTGKDRWDTKGIDSCIAPLISALNDIGWTTVNSCCGHGQYRGIITLLDGRYIMILGPEDKDLVIETMHKDYPCTT